MKRIDRVITVEDIRESLPKVGDTLYLSPTLLGYCAAMECEKRPCTVTYVNRKHLWFAVKFDGSGIIQGYRFAGFKETEPKTHYNKRKEHCYVN